jgi:hypothetical protein
LTGSSGSRPRPCRSHWPRGWFPPPARCAARTRCPAPSGRQPPGRRTRAGGPAGHDGRRRHRTPAWPWRREQNSAALLPPETLCCVEPQPVIGTPLQDPAGDRLLAAHGIQRHDAILQGQHLEQHRDRGDLVRFAIDLGLAEHQALLTGADPVQRPLRPAEGPAQGFAIDRDDLPVKRLGKIRRWWAAQPPEGRARSPGVSWKGSSGSRSHGAVPYRLRASGVTPATWRRFPRRRLPESVSRLTGPDWKLQ